MKEKQDDVEAEDVQEEELAKPDEELDLEDEE